MTDQEVLHSVFNFKTHSKHFICYCEVIIHPDGLIEYAIPSHQDKLIQVYAKKNKLTKEQVFRKWKNKWNAIDEMMKNTGIVFVWYDRIERVIPLTEQQKTAISLLNKYNCTDIEDFKYEKP